MTKFDHKMVHFLHTLLPGCEYIWEEILHQLRLLVYPIVNMVLEIPGGAEFLPSTVSQQTFQVPKNRGTLTYISCMDTAYVRETPPPK